MKAVLPRLVSAINSIQKLRNNYVIDLKAYMGDM
jgi:hypothetical protein